MAKRLIDPHNIKYDDLPLIVLSDHSWSPISWVIKWRTKSSWNHAMIMVRPGEFVSQGWFLNKVPIKKFMKRGSRLKFWKIKDLSDSGRIMIETEVREDLRLPKWKTRYDFFGILGQAVGIKVINAPWVNYCSERVSRWLSRVIKGLNSHASPKDLNVSFKKNERLECYGYWFSD